MKHKTILAGTFAAFVCVACSSPEADTSPLPPQDSQTRAENAQKQVASSNMTEEQKQAAAAYLKQGAENAQKMESSAKTASGGAPN